MASDNKSGPPPKKTICFGIGGNDTEHELEASAGQPGANNTSQDTTDEILNEIEKCQDSIDDIDKKSADALSKVEKEYNAMKKPYYNHRNDCIKRVPNFWLTTLIQHPLLSTLISEEEENCLQYLTQLEVEEGEDQSSFAIKFYFDQNPYFENEVLVKEYILGDDQEECASTEIQWKENMNLLKKLPQTFPGRKRGLEEHSFLSWFADNDVESEPCIDIAGAIKDEIWKNPLQYYNPDNVTDADETEEEEEDESINEEEEYSGGSGGVGSDEDEEHGYGLEEDEISEICDEDGESKDQTEVVNEKGTNNDRDTVNKPCLVPNVTSVDKDESKEKSETL